MKYRISIIFLTLLIFSCSNNNVHINELNTLLTDYNNQKNLSKAIKIGEYYNKYFRKDKKKIEEGISFLQTVYDIYKDDRFNLLLGNYYTILGGIYAKKLDYSNAMKNIDLGCELLDQAVKKYPDDIYYLIYRGINSASLPKMLGRADYAILDLNKIIESGTASDTDKILAYYYLSKVLKDKGEKEKAKKVTEELKRKYPNYKESIK